MRPPSPGKIITDNLPTVRIDPETLDMFSEVNPLSELPGCMRDKTRLVYKIEFPKWARRNKLIDYGWGVFKGILKMDFGQSLAGGVVSKTKQENPAALKKEIKEKSIVKFYSSLYVVLKVDETEVLVQQLWTDKQPRWVNREMLIPQI